LEISNEKAMQGERSFRTKVKKNNKPSRIKIWKNEFLLNIITAEKSTVSVSSNANSEMNLHNDVR